MGIDYAFEGLNTQFVQSRLCHLRPTARSAPTQDLLLFLSTIGKFVLRVHVVINAILGDLISCDQ
jgi:hypothetical protein